MFTLAPLILLIQVAQLGPGWKVIRSRLLGHFTGLRGHRYSASRDSASQRNEETMQRQTLAMDSSGRTANRHSE